MTDCTKCIHEHVCDQSSRLMWSRMAKEPECSDFKDRAGYVEVQHGKWIHPKDHVVANEFFCSECNKRTASLRPINRQPNGALLADENGNFYYPPTMKYCSECGAKMDGDVNG